ncbi:hypothetical protein LSH36_987g00024 [Paralvinella palmiformis]|uniref:Uncharacterized protein n=1 Tax=Paralvinella palmiformis TaxID=53620 RepID=A0AAD9IXM4_9ANNE|nr:hypothetical protein LSH36_987g00024 [Paralvinella palmiformis]
MYTKGAVKHRSSAPATYKYRATDDNFEGYTAARRQYKNAYRRAIAVRINDYVEGWYNRFNNMATNQSPIPIYKMIHPLHTESQNVNPQLSLRCFTTNARNIVEYLPPFLTPGNS